jgi:Phage tail sheath C-terminal domain
MALVSPGVSITVTDESQYVSNAVGTVPLIVLATAQDKTINGSLATGTTKTNAGALQVFGSQRELSTAMGYPVFQQSSAGTPLHGDELNEYGLMAAYSALGVGNQMFAIRADIDLNELKGTSVRPTSAVADGTLWFDALSTTWGIYEWSAETQSFTEQTPYIIESSTQTTSANAQGVFSGGSGYAYTPVQSLGGIGQYAVVMTDEMNRTYYKGGNGVSNTNYGQTYYGQIYNKWLLVGTPAWHASSPAVTGTVNTSSLVLPTNSNVFVYVNGSNVRVQTGSTYSMANVATAINQATITGVSADVVNGVLALYSDGSSSGLAANDGKVHIYPDPAWNSASNVALINAVGITAGAYVTPLLQSASTTQPGFNSTGYGSYTSVPPWTDSVSGDVSAPTGSIWLKQGVTGGGSNFVFKRYNATTGLWAPLAVNSYADEAQAIYAIDPTGGGVGISAGTVWIDQDPNTFNSSVLGYAGYRPRIRTVNGAVTATGSVANPVFTNGTQFNMGVSVVGLRTLTTVTVTISGTTAADFVTSVTAAAGSVPNPLPVIAELNSNGTVSLTHSQGGVIVLTPSGGINVPYIAGFRAATNHVSVTGTEGSSTSVATISGFSTPTYVVSDTTPVADPANGTLWYYSDPTVIDVMINTGTAWKGYQNVTSDARGYDLSVTDEGGVIAAASAPSTQSTGAALVAGDLWLNTSDLENWPALSRWNGSAWVAIDNTDQITTGGVVFADARWDTTGTVDPASGTEATTVELLTSDYLDLDAPNPQLYPRGILLVNTRRSGYNVKKFVQNYFNTTVDDVPAYSGSTVYAAGKKVAAGSTIYVSMTNGNTGNAITNTTYWKPLQTGTWVTASGLKANGSPYAGHHAQRQIVVAALKSAIDSNTQIREDQFSYSLICAPGYPELIPNMVSLNNDRSNTAFVIGDTPMSLSTNVVEINNWSNNTNGDGLATNDPYMAVYYPSGLSTDLAGNTIVVPASHMALRTFLYNDNVAYQWFAPAGTRRGLVSNATDLGYIDLTTGEFIRTGVNQALRDSLYQLRINPITIIPGIGLVVWGQKTRDPNTESLDRVNVARLVNYIRTIFASAGNAFLFEPNDKITRDQFAGVLNRALNDLVAKRGIYDYLVVCDTTNNTPDRIANNQLYADVAIEPTKDVEFIYIPVRLFNPGDIAGLGSK